MAGLITMGLLPGQSIEVAGIDASKPWNRTGLVLECGVTYRYEVIDLAGWRDGRIETDPNGYERLHLLPLVPARRYPLGHWLKLIGAIGTSAWNYFPIGQGCTRKAAAAGELYCFANDASFRYRDNDGHLTLRITRED
ncbi:MAG: hypothetical protein GTO28_15745 [Gammaproteobacteria bacterium]|nr:hypothetical protein [Gammaproteobacteria bacterium]NIM74461.1 hypothetical protein [Gammaproteobacteria bacterium]NIO26294.1 hypothetical protein [Gammaproteobacteria bacterium]NIO66846.1 hypothetical protein [Gammaproteobacteria bacterium]NIP45156.1 hypothetical protein [Gammaproteobacteria bacterium]